MTRGSTGDLDLPATAATRPARPVPYAFLRNPVRSVTGLGAPGRSLELVAEDGGAPFHMRLIRDSIDRSYLLDSNGRTQRIELHGAPFVCAHTACATGTVMCVHMLAHAAVSEQLWQWRRETFLRTSLELHPAAYLECYAPSDGSPAYTALAVRVEPETVLVGLHLAKPRTSFLVEVEQGLCTACFSEDCFHTRMSAGAGSISICDVLLAPQPTRHRVLGPRVSKKFMAPGIGWVRYDAWLQARDNHVLLSYSVTAGRSRTRAFASALVESSSGTLQCRDHSDAVGELCASRNLAQRLYGVLDRPRFSLRRRRNGASSR